MKNTRWGRHGILGTICPSDSWQMLEEVGEDCNHVFSIAEKKTARINRNSRGLTALTNPEMRRINGPAWELSWTAESENQVVSVQKLATN